MLRKTLTFGLALCLTAGGFLSASNQVSAQETKVEQKQEKKVAKKGYVFGDEKRVACSEIKSQDNTGTCWCFAGTSFLEAELTRTGKGTHDLSEMFIVRNVYQDKAKNYVLRKGKATFGQGALAHDYIRSVSEKGVVPQSIYSGLEAGASRHNHGEMASYLEDFLKVVVAKKKKTGKWKKAYAGIVDAFLGTPAKEFEYQGKKFTAETFRDSLGFNADDYVNLTSFSHHPFGKPFVLEIPDNFSNGSFMNVPIDELVEIIDEAVANGYSVAWDGDVSEKGFNAGRGLAINPVRVSGSSFRNPGKEKKVTQDMRQLNFENYVTTDDHLMHLVGTAKDQNGTKYYIIKNSWGKIGPKSGYLYMSESYLRQNVVAITVHKDVVPEKYRK